MGGCPHAASAVEGAATTTLMMMVPAPHQHAPCNASVSAHKTHTVVATMRGARLLAPLALLALAAGAHASVILYDSASSRYLKSSSRAVQVDRQLLSSVDAALTGLLPAAHISAQDSQQVRTNRTSSSVPIAILLHTPPATSVSAVPGAAGSCCVDKQLLSDLGLPSTSPASPQRQHPLNTAPPHAGQIESIVQPSLLRKPRVLVSLSVAGLSAGKHAAHFGLAWGGPAFCTWCLWASYPAPCSWQWHGSQHQQARRVRGGSRGQTAGLGHQCKNKNAMHVCMG